MKISRVCILGGTGFVGRHLVARLDSAGIPTRIIARHPQRARGLQVSPRAEVVEADPFNPDQLRTAMLGCDVAVNLVGILNESGNRTFQRLHVELADRVMAACGEAGVGRLLHMSALNANESNGPSAYLKSKGEAENRTHTLRPPQVKVTSFRPSVIFGPGDSFFNRFGALLRMLPGPFPLACPDARFAPVYVGDVADAFVRVIDDPATHGKHYQLCGPERYSLRELVEYTARQLNLKRPVIGLGDGASRLQARLLGLLPGKPFSSDNYLSLQVDSVCSSDGLAELGITPTPLDSVVPYYLSDEAQRPRYLRLRRLI